MKKKTTHLVANILVLFIFIMKLHAREELPIYEHYVNEIVNSFCAEVEAEHKGLTCSGSGGSMPDNVRKISVDFYASFTASVEEARLLQVSCAKKLLNKINSHEKIKPYLVKYPFTPKEISISISFYDKNGKRPLDGSVARTLLAIDKIFYKKAEMVKKIAPSFLDASDPKNITHAPPEEYISEELIDLYNEPFEEAVKIVEATQEKEIKKEKQRI